MYTTKLSNLPSADVLVLMGCGMCWTLNFGTGHVSDCGSSSNALML